MPVRKNVLSTYSSSFCTEPYVFVESVYECRHYAQLLTVQSSTYLGLLTTRLTFFFFNLCLLLAGGGAAAWKQLPYILWACLMNERQGIKFCTIQNFGEKSTS